MNHHRRRGGMGLIIAMACALVAGMALGADGPVKPNVLFILADDLGWRDVGCFGSTFHETPNIDRLASRGLRFTQAYAASPLCSPTRSSILAGQYPARIGITSPVCHLPQAQLEKRLAKGGPAIKVLNADSLTRLKSEYFTLAEALHEAGYATAHFGKWHLGYNGPYEPKDQGFDLDFPHEPSLPGPGGGYLAPWKFIKDPAIKGKPGEHIEDRMSQEAAKFILAHKDQPFYVNYWAYSVHSPWNARKDYIEHFQKTADEKNPQHNPLYAAMVKSLDDGVGNLLAAIEQAGVADRTIIVFFSDNGGWAFPPKTTDPEGFTGMPATSNLPLRSGKASLYEGGTREPCIFAWPGKIAAGASTNAFFQSVDFYPTLLAMCGVKPHADVKLDGFNQYGTLLGQASPRDRVFCHFPHGSPNQAAQIPGFLPGTYVRRGDWKLIRFFADNDDGSDRFELYNLAEDVGESKNVASQHPDIVKELNELIGGFLRDTEAVIPVRNPNYQKSEDNTADPLRGWKARGCDAAVKDGVLHVTGKSAAPFLGYSAGESHGPAVVKVRLRCAAGGSGKIEWLGTNRATNAAKAQSAPFDAAAKDDWQEIRVEIPARGQLGIVRIYLPAASQTVQIEWIELKAQGPLHRWTFGK